MDNKIYRKDIDGLRAIAVISVFAFHLFPHIFTRGFIGVDIFFVISGYLITQKLISDYSRGAFNILKFYESRFKRIFPALIIVLTFSLSLSLFSLYSGELLKFTKHLISSLFFISNYIYLNESNYFDTSSAYKPLLHLWSLSIEAQFYLIIPFIILFGLKINRLMETIIFLLFLFYVLNFFHDRISSAFFSFFRIWEILIGSLTLLLEKEVNRRKILFFSYNKFLNIASFFILILSLCISTKTRNPQFYSLIPTFCTFLLIIGGQNNYINKKFLSQQYLVFIGLISYPLYLWHWPLISFSEIIHNLNILNKFFIVFLSLFLAYFTYKLVENPIRFNFKRSTNLINLLIASFILISSSIMIYYNNGYPNRYDKFSRINSGIQDKDVQKRIIKCSPVKGVIDSWCLKTNAPQVALIGDSHADLLMPAFIETKDKIFSNILSLGAGNCSPSYIKYLPMDRCQIQSLNNLKTIKSNKNLEYIIITSWGNGIRKIEDALPGHKYIFDEILRAGKKIIYIIDMPTLLLSPDLCKKQSLPIRALFQKKYDFCNSAKLNLDFSKKYFDKGRYTLLIKELKNQYPNLLFYDPKKLFCNDKACKIINSKDNRLIYSDEGHIGIYAARILVRKLLKDIDNKKY